MRKLKMLSKFLFNILLFPFLVVFWAVLIALIVILDVLEEL